MAFSRLNRFKKSLVDPWPFRAVLNIPAGLFGFESLTMFSLIKHKEKIPYLRLESERNAAISFAVIDPFFVYPDYEPMITQKDIQDIGVVGDSELILFAIVNMQEKPFTMNLSAPLLIYWEKKQGKQLLFPADVAYPLD